MEREQKEHHAIRGLYMLLFWIFLRLSLLLTALVAIFQWAILWFQDEPLDALVDFSSSLNQYQHQILRYLTFKTEDKVFPFADWPSAEKLQ